MEMTGPVKILSSQKRKSHLDSVQNLNDTQIQYVDLHRSLNACAEQGNLEGKYKRQNAEFSAFPDPFQSIHQTSNTNTVTPMSFSFYDELSLLYSIRIIFMAKPNLFSDNRKLIVQIGIIKGFKNPRGCGWGR